MRHFLHKKATACLQQLHSQKQVTKFSVKTNNTTHTHTHAKWDKVLTFFKQSIFFGTLKKKKKMFIQQCMNIQQKSQNGNDAKQSLLTRALLGKASTIFLATQWLAKIMHSAIVSWTSRCCTEQSTNDLVHHNKVAREIE